MALSLDGNSKELVNRIAVILASSLILVVLAAVFYDRRREIKDRNNRRPATWAIALLVCSYLLLIPALFATLFNMTIGAVDTLVLKQISESTVSFIRLLEETGGWTGAVLVAIFAMVVPLVKIFLLILAECWRFSQDRRRIVAARMCIRFVQCISKWACPDLIAYIFLFYLVRHLNQPPVNGLFSLDVGFTCYAFFCWGSTISSLGVHLPALEEQDVKSEPKEPLALRVFGRNGIAVLMLFIQVAFVVCFVLGMLWACLGIRLDASILKNNGLPQWQIDAMISLGVVENAKADVTIFECINLLVKMQAEFFDANAILSIIMLVVFVLGLTLLDMLVLAVAALQLLRPKEDQSCALINLTKHLKKLAMLDVLILGILVMVISGSVYRDEGLVLKPERGLLALAGAEAMHYLAYALVHSSVKEATSTTSKASVLESEAKRDEVSVTSTSSERSISLPTTASGERQCSENSEMSIESLSCHV